MSVTSIPEDDSDLESTLESIFDPDPEPEPEPGWWVGQTPPVATEASDPADDLADFKRQVVEVATRLAKEHGLCNEVDKALEELGLPIRNREHTVTMTVTVQIDLGPDSDPREWDNERIAEYGRTVVEDALENTGATVTDATTTTPTADRSK